MSKTPSSVTNEQSAGAGRTSLAIHTGSPVRTQPWPARHLFGDAEKAAAMRLFDEAIQTGDAFGYQGKYEEAYCKAFADWLGGGFVDAVNSGTTAVYVALRSLDLAPGSEVIVPPITDAGGVMPVAMLGLIPVPADSRPGAFNVGVEQIAARITSRTSAIVIAHIAGHPCEMGPILELASRHNLKVVEDCAQAHGATYQGKKVGSFGDVAAFSTMSGKHHATAAQGGVVFTRDEKTYCRIRQAADRGKPFGVTQPAGNVMAGLNLNSNELACAVGLVQLEKLPAHNERRQAFAKKVIDGLHAMKSQAVEVYDAPVDCKSVYWFLVMKLNLAQLTVDKDTFAKALAAEGIPVMPTYWHCPVTQPWYVNRKVLPCGEFPWSLPGADQRRWTAADLPNAVATADTHFVIPMHENCTATEAQDILAALSKLQDAYRS